MNVSENSFITVTFKPMGCKVKVKHSANILNAALRAGISIRTECGGKGLCGKCKVIVDSENLKNELTEAELKHLSPQEISLGYRLACQVIPKRDLQVIVPEESMRGQRKILAMGLERSVPLNPLIKKLHLKIQKPSLSDIEADFERIIRALLATYGIKKIEIDYHILKMLPDILRSADWDVTVVLWNDTRIISVEPGDTSDRLLGFAVDVGTSKIVGHLVDLVTGKTLSVSSTENPQIIYGADIITRITHAMEGEANLDILHKAVIQGVNVVLAQVCEKAKVDPNHIYEATVVGNTAMHHLFLGIQPKYTAVSPYTPAVKTQINVIARELGMKMNPNGIICVLPIIAGFVGADAIGDILATGIHESEKLSLLIDIGTNTEVIIGNSQDILCCSCASGPAFEGARITNGMKAEAGAIERVRVKSDGKVEYKTIGNLKPRGICGSAMVDIMAEMYKHGIIDQHGRFNSQIRLPRLKKEGNEMKFVIAEENETATGKEITVTQRDIREIQLAKAAIHAGFSILMHRKNIKEKDLSKVYIAGAFGSYINPENAKLIGLVPDVPLRKIKFIGNAAVIGAKISLISKETRQTAEMLSKKIRYIELGVDPDFGKEFFSAMSIPHKIQSDSSVINLNDDIH